MIDLSERKMPNNLMDLNHETAMRLWSKSFGKQTKAIDFAGREIAKGAYNDRNSQYGWNVDHILPQSKGGTTADHNLVCCSIQTNDEKADKFPCFYANGCKFEITKVQNHYEIRSAGNKKAEPAKNEECINFYDSAAGVRFFKNLKGIQNKKRFVGYVLIRLQNFKNTAIFDFIEKIFEDENISFSIDKINFFNALNYGTETKITIIDYNMPTRENISNLLDKCVLLNTYLKSYFLALNYLENYEIRFAVECYENKTDMYKKYDNFGSLNYNLNNTLFINRLAVINTEAEKKIDVRDGFNEYNYIYTNLSKNLIKEVEGK